MRVLTSRVRVDGKFFALGDERFRLRGVTYGTFRTRGDGASFPEREQVKRDFAAINEAGFNVVRTYSPPPVDIIELAADWDLYLLPDIFYADWRYLVGMSRRELRRVARVALAEVVEATRRVAGIEHVMGLSLGNEVPADVLRWLGTKTVVTVLDDLADAVRALDPDLLVTYANYPTAEYLPLDGLDFLTFNVFLEQQQDFRSYLTRLQLLAGERPVILGEMGSHAGEDLAGERRQAESLDWQMETALDRGLAGACVFSWTDDWWVDDREVEGWRFGLTRADRSPRPALDVAMRWNTADVRDLRSAWPSMRVIICAYNAAATLDECLRHTMALEYPNLEIVVVDDGSTDNTAAIARQYAGVRLVSIEHSGLGAARNEGLRASTGDLVAYLDSDAYPSPEWPFYLVLGLDRANVGGVGGPNLAPRTDPLGSQVVAQSPGGPAHVLLADDRAEHVPGCNMAFWRLVLDEVAGFDPVYTAAGDDVDVCWKVLDRRWEIGFHAAAVVWHHRRGGLLHYLRQQRGYGRAEGVVAARHPDRFTPMGTARWHGHIYGSLAHAVGRPRIYRGPFGAAEYQSIYRGTGDGLAVAHQAGIPLALGLIAVCGTLALASGIWAAGAAAGLAFLGVIGGVDAVRARPPHGLQRGRLRFRYSVAAHSVLQPLARTWGRLTGMTARRSLPSPATLPGPVRRVGSVVVLPEDGRRPDLAAGVITALRQAGFRVVIPTGWEAFDARLNLAALVYGELLTSSHPPGSVQVRVRPRVRRWRVMLAAAATVVVALQVSLVVTAAIVVVVALDSARGVWRARRRVARVLRRAAR